jgi:hypothetical protein
VPAWKLGGLSGVLRRLDPAVAYRHIDGAAVERVARSPSRADNSRFAPRKDACDFAVAALYHPLQRSFEEGDRTPSGLRSDFAQNGVEPHPTLTGGHLMSHT